VDRHAILDRLDLAVQPGEIHALPGANGSGKTTRAYMLMGCEGQHRVAEQFSLPASISFPSRSTNGPGWTLTLAWQEPVRFEGVAVREYLTLGKSDWDPEPALRQVGLTPERYLDRRLDKALSGGERSRGLIKTLVVLEGQAQTEITGITEAYAKGARGHADCMEIVQDQAKASAIPIVRVFYPEGMVTHEAAIGSVDKKKLETLMARGLSPEQGRRTHRERGSAIVREVCIFAGYEAGKIRLRLMLWMCRRVDSGSLTPRNCSTSSPRVDLKTMVPIPRSHSINPCLMVVALMFSIAIA
jgi:ABC-type uncharacterized transport system YnjBCD ATPase subunit